MLNITNEDNMQLMARYDNKHFDLAIVDPPYGIGQNAFRAKSRSKLAKTTDWGSFDWDKEPPPPEYFKELFRVSKNQIIWGANHFIDLMPYRSSCWLVWDKDNGKSNFADCELAWTSFDTAVRLFKYRWNGMLQQNMKYKEKRIHPTQKPVSLYKWILKNYAKPGDLIFDSHLGSGSIAIACEELEYDLVACEIDQQKYNDAMRRIKNHNQLLLKL